MNHIENLKRFDAIIPDGEGLVYCQLFSDETYIYLFEMYGVLIAESHNGCHFMQKSFDGESEHEFVALIGSLNTILTEIQTKIK